MGRKRDVEPRAPVETGITREAGWAAFPTPAATRPPLVRRSRRGERRSTSTRSFPSVHPPQGSLSWRSRVPKQAEVRQHGGRGSGQVSVGNATTATQMTLSAPIEWFTATNLNIASNSFLTLTGAFSGSGNLTREWAGLCHHWPKFVGNQQRLGWHAFHQFGHGCASTDQQR